MFVRVNKQLQNKDAYMKKTCLVIRNWEGIKRGDVAYKESSISLHIW